MSIAELIIKLQHAAAPDRKLDEALALVVGYSKRSEFYKSAGDDRSHERWYWVNKKNRRCKLPEFTRSMHDSYNLTQSLTPTHSFAIAWDDRGGKAAADDGQYIRASSAAIALCIVALQIRWAEQDKMDN